MDHIGASSKLKKRIYIKNVNRGAEVILLFYTSQTCGINANRLKKVGDSKTSFFSSIYTLDQIMYVSLSNSYDI